MAPSTDGPERAWLLRATRVLTPTEQFQPGVVAVVGRRVVAVGPAATTPRLDGAAELDLGDATILPGFVDVHLHGSGGDTAMDGAAAVTRISRFLARHGVTAWLPTLTPCPTIDETAEVVREALRSDADGPGAEPVGLHLEGPFVNPKRPGALRVECFRAPSLPELDRLLDAADGQIRLMTIAPELPGGLDLVRRLVDRGTVVSIGHSDALGAQTFAAIERGVTHATHTFNAMRPLHHRDPGVVGAVLTADRVRGELIADGVHVDRTAIQVLVRAKGPFGVVVVTDAVAPAGLPDGDYEFDGRPITSRGGKATLVDGTIAGSVATFDRNVRFLVGEVGLPLPAVARMAASTPARAIGLNDRKGVIAPGYDADLVALDPGLNVVLTMTRGQIAYRRANQEERTGGRRPPVLSS